MYLCTGTRLSLPLLLVAIACASTSAAFAQNAEAERLDLEGHLDAQVELLEQVEQLPTCHRAVLVALKDRRVRDLFLQRLRERCFVLKDVCCLRIPHVLNQELVLFDFDCAPGCFCLLDPQFRVDVDLDAEKVIKIHEPYLGPTRPCYSILRTAGQAPTARLNAGAPEKRLSREELETHLDKQLRLLEKIEELPACHRAVRIALQDPKVRDLFLRKLHTRCFDFKDICCLQIPHILTHEYVLFDFDCAPPCFCFVDPQFRVDVDLNAGKVVKIHDPYLGPTRPCFSILRETHGHRESDTDCCK